MLNASSAPIRSDPIRSSELDDGSSRGVLDSGVQQLQQAVFIWERALGFSQLAELPVYRFDGVGGVDRAPDIGRIPEVDLFEPIHSRRLHRQRRLR